MPGTSTVASVAVDREPVGRHARRARGAVARTAPGRSPASDGVTGERREDPLRAGRQVADPGTGRVGDGRDDGRGADVHRQLADALDAVRRAGERRLDEDRADARRIERGRDDVRRQPVVEVAAVAQLDLLDRGVADGLERAALDLALGQDRVDDPTDVVGGDHVADVDLAGVEVDVDPGDAGGPAERRVGVAGVGLVVERRAARIRLEALVDAGAAVIGGQGDGTMSANEPPVSRSTCSRSRRAAWMSSPPTTIAVRDATVGPLSGT